MDIPPALPLVDVPGVPGMIYTPGLAKLALKEYRSLCRCNPDKDLTLIKKSMKKMSRIVKTGISEEI